MIIVVLHNIGVCEEQLDNYSRVLEALSLAAWLLKVFLLGLHLDLHKIVETALSEARDKVS